MDEKIIPGAASNTSKTPALQQKSSATPASPLSLELTQDERWYVVQALARREPVAKMRLEAQGYRIFLPQMIKTVRHARKMRQSRVAVFPGYLFVALNPLKDRWRNINGTIGVARMITANEGPAPVPRGIVESLASYLDDFGICRFDRDLKEGQQVRIVSGPFAHLIGQIATLDGKGRARVLLKIMSNEIVTTLDQSSLELAG
ncbi:MAG: transcription antiterminator NusG [Alphaproteobacteria bacterium]|nr:transcription antiterminator NusG [Alphaproteobacteria bacterium]